MPGKNEKKYTKTINHLGSLLGADPARDLIKVALSDVDDPENIPPIRTQLTEISGRVQSAVDVADAIDQLVGALESNANDSIRVTSPSPLDVSASEVPVDVSSQSLSHLVITDNGSLSVAQLPEPLDVSDSAITLGSYTGGDLPVVIQSPVDIGNQPVGVTGNNNDQASFNDEAISANGEKTLDLSAEGADEIRGKIQCDQNYTVELRYLDSPGGTPLFDSPYEVVNGEAGGTATTFTETASSPHIRVVITQSDGNAGVVDASVSM
jgi:hypothetical protein